MKIAIELLIILIMFAISIVWFIYFAISNRVSVRRYKQENDKGWLGEENRKRLIEESRGRESESSESVSIDNGQRGASEQINLSATEIDNRGKEDSSIGKTSCCNGESSGRIKSFRNPFKKRK